MNHSPPLLLLGLVCLLSSCEKSGQGGAATKQTVDYATPGARWQSETFTPWMSRAELQHFQSNSPSDQYFAHVEGRNNSGQLEYRAVLKPFTGEQYEQWAVFWGIDEQELFKCEMKLLGLGFTRQDTQVFADETGKAIHQIVWLKPKTRVEEPEAPQPSAVADNTIPEAVPAPPVEAIDPVISLPQDETVKEVPVATRVPEAPVSAAPVESDSKPAKIPKGPIYVVRQGDTLGKIAKSKKVSVEELRSINHLKSDVLRIGQKLVTSSKAK